MDTGELTFLALPFIVAFSLGFGLWFVFRQRALLRREQAARAGTPPATGGAPPAPRAEDRRPWWSNPWLWLGLSAVFVVLGLVVSERLFGIVFIFIPLLWISIPRRSRPPIDPHQNGHRGNGHRPA